VFDVCVGLQQNGIPSCSTDSMLRTYMPPLLTITSTYTAVHCIDTDACPILNNNTIRKYMYSRYSYRTAL